MKNVIVYRDPGRYAGWPANYGLWAWGEEIVVGFTVGYNDPNAGFHTRDRSRPFVAMQARSLDGGETWEVQPTPCRTPGGRGLSADEHVVEALRAGATLADENAPFPCPGGVDFTHPDFALMCGRSGLNAGAVSWFYLSTDRCRSWQGPYQLPDFGQTGIAARTDYLVYGPQEALLFLTAAKPDGREGRVFCARTVDGGRSFAFLSWIGEEPAGYSIMPSSVRLPGGGLPSGRLLTAIRRREGRELGEAERFFIELFASDDQGSSWRYLNEPVSHTGQGGNPPAMIRLQDGRLALTYGYRAAPFGLRARLSEDEGLTWGPELVLRQDGGNHDLGYPRTTQRPDGAIVTAYYYNDDPLGERYIAATIWEPPR